MSASKLNDQQRLYAYLRWLEVGNKAEVGRELGVTESTVRRIVSLGLDYLRERAGGAKPRLRVKASSNALTLPRLEGSIEKEKDANVQGAKPVYNPTNPLGEPLEPTGLSVLYGKRGKMGTRELITQHGTTIVSTEDGRVVRVERCPVHGRIGVAYGFEDVDITLIDGIKVRGKYTQLSGEVVEGTLIFDGEGSNGSRRVTSVVFIPDAAKGALEKAEIIRDKPKVA